MAKDSSFDIVSEVDMQEMDNAINMAKKDIKNRFDFKGSCAEISLEDDCIKLIAEDDYKIGAMLDTIRGKIAKRNISQKSLDPQKVENGASGNKKQTINIHKGLSKEKAKEIVAFIKTLKLKVNAQINDDVIRVSAAKKDDLQAVIIALNEKDFSIPLQFTNYR